MGKQFGEKIIKEVRELQEQGLSKTQIGEQFGLSRIQIENLLYTSTSTTTSAFS